MSNRTKPIPGFGNPSCYARALGGCCRQMSGEHPLSRALLERIDQELGELSKAVEIRNLAFQPRNVSQRIGIGSLESKILCVHHNNALSEYDQQALATFVAFEKLHYAAAGHPVVIQSLYTVNADRLGRFFLKAFCGCLYAGLFPDEEASHLKDVEPSLDWLESLYHGQPLPDGHGLYFKSSPEVITADRTIVGCRPLVMKTDERGISVHGFRFWLFGFEFTMLAPGPEPRAIDALRDQAYRPNGLTVLGSGMRIRFVWETGPRSGGITVGRT